MKLTQLKTSNLLFVFPVPPPAVVISVDGESSRSISIHWSTPDLYPGPTNYSLEVWRKPGQCEAFKKDSKEKSVQGDKAADDWGLGRTDTVEGLTPYSQYYVRMILVTDAGGSKSQNSSIVRTLPESRWLLMVSSIVFCWDQISLTER